MKAVHRVAFVAALMFALNGAATPAQAQQGGAQAQQGAAIQALPPALRAAVLAGNSAQVQQAIQTLSGGNITTAAGLAAQVIAAAEQILTTSPEAAVRVAVAAVETVRPANVQQGAPQASEQVVATAARIFISPPAA
ncbi:MAG TPA: hypothetical protein PKZ97_17220, partial [Azospirillaceae bacterium]|nr:hypothetical protein [Azospirillaceae bacterium]